GQFQLANGVNFNWQRGSVLIGEQGSTRRGFSTIQGKYELPENDGKIHKIGRRNRRFPEREVNENNM
ncbi:hypothetical protein M2101_001653, partial [Parabacteroides sp. PM5-20]|uniref:hypothetical protein n=1 Tax=Parabacteroides sp. PM5-20 TaxID=2940527 RepID=UPI00247388EF